MLAHKKAFLGLGVVGVLIAVAVIVSVSVVRARRPHTGPTPAKAHPDTAAAPVTDEPEQFDTEPGVTTVTTIQPRRDPSLAIRVEEPAYVQAYYRADLEAVHVAGTVKFVKADIGQPVKAGDRLVEIEVPDLVQQVAQKEAFVEQKKMELKLAEANARVALATIGTAENEVKQKEAMVDVAEAERVFRMKEFKRFQGLAAERAVLADIVDEREKFYQSAEATTAGARVSVLKAKSDLQEAKAKWEAASVDIKLKESFVKVAEEDRNQAQTLCEFATVRAPFDGVVMRRHVNPGSFVQNAATGTAKPLLTVERTDVVTIHMKVPDNYAPYVTKDTEAFIEMTAFPGQLIHAKVTRFSPSLEEADRTMRVEVDLYNGTEREYEAFLAREKATGYADLKAGPPPMFPKVAGNVSGQSQRGRLLPGMVGKMQLLLGRLHNAYLLPNTAIVRERGKPYVYEVKDGIAHLRPVEVEVDDGKVVKIAIIETVGDEEVKRSLTGQEEIISSNHGEIRDGQPVKTTAVEW